MPVAPRWAALAQVVAAAAEAGRALQVAVAAVAGPLAKSRPAPAAPGRARKSPFPIRSSARRPADGKTPVPAVMAFHAAGNDYTQLQNAFKNSDLAKNYFIVYPGSSGNGWNMQADKSRYLDAYAALLSQACVDENRIYATGHSSGAQMIVQLLCSGDAKFDGIAPVASSVYCQEWKNGPVPALVIHGVLDKERQAYGLNDGDGKKDLQPYLTSNSCQMPAMGTPFDPDLSKCGGINGIDGKAFDDGCVELMGCTAKTRWCNHNDPQYGTSNHGIPCFGVRAIYDFFESL
jgi:poly(3-hydroxybutyrate) depolymerase